MDDLYAPLDPVTCPMGDPNHPPDYECPICGVHYGDAIQPECLKYKSEPRLVIDDGNHDDDDLLDINIKPGW